MIIDLTISNFHSIRDEQTFSLHAESIGTHLTDNIAYPEDEKIGVLKTSGIYGANASGKSNILVAFETLRYIISFSERLKEGDQIRCYEPFLLSKTCKLSPVRFEVEFVVNKQRFRYVVEFTAKRIVNESLIYFPQSRSRKPAVLFNRDANDDWQTIKFGDSLKGGRKRIAFFENNAYLSKAGSSADAPEMLQSIYNYFRINLMHIGADERLSKLNWLEDEKLVKKTAKLLSLVDTGITGISVRESLESEPIKLPEDMPEDFKQLILKDSKNKAFFNHSGDDGNTEYFDRKLESVGTLKLFDLAPAIIETLEDGGVMIMDELDNSMHPFMAELIIKLFNDTRVNKNNAQLIFSTHNINLMSSEYFRRDQIWFTEKINGVTTLYSLDDFDKNKVKPQSPFNQWYAEGRFGAVPVINYEGLVSLLANSGEIDA